ncbi:hypothetical protein ACFL5V_00585 [Fibrobacterota bacterium]
MYIAAGKGVLIFNQSKNAWESSIRTEHEIKDIFYSQERDKLRILTGQGALEYNENFRDWYAVDSLRFTAGDSGKLEQEQLQALSGLSGVSMPYPWHFMGDAIRDKYMRQSPVTRAVVFDYDRLWVLTSGSGVFTGSKRRSFIKPAWFGLDDPNIHTVFIHQGKIWFGSNNSGSAFIRTDEGLNDWEQFRPGHYGGSFPNAAVWDMVFWNGFYWLATDDGVVRFNPDANQFARYGYFQGLRADKAICLEVHGNRLYAGTERGLTVLEGPHRDFRPLPHPNIRSLKVYSLKSHGNQLWVASKFGLYMFNHQNQGWSQPRTVYVTQGLPILDVVAEGDAIYWIEADKLMRQTGTKPSVELKKYNNLKNLKIHGGYVYGAYDSGVFAYNLKNGLDVDYGINDGIIGKRVNTLAIENKYLWVATDLGVSRINGARFLP